MEKQTQSGQPFSGWKPSPAPGWKALDMDNLIRWTLMRLLKEKMGSEIQGHWEELTRQGQEIREVYLAKQGERRNVGKAGAGGLWWHSRWHAQTAEFLSPGVCTRESLLVNVHVKFRCHHPDYSCPWCPAGLAEPHMLGPGPGFLEDWAEPTI